MASDGALEKLKKHSYPGNIRELENIIMSAVSLADKEHVLTEKQILVQEAYHEKGGNDYDPEKESLDQYMARLENDIIREMMVLCGGNISKAAKQLGIKRQTLQHKLKKYNV